MIELQAETRQTIARMPYQFFVIQPDGSIRYRNEHGIALDWVYRQRAAALRAAKRGKAAVYDKTAGRFVE